MSAITEWRVELDGGEAIKVEAYAVHDAVEQAIEELETAGDLHEVDASHGEAITATNLKNGEVFSARLFVEWKPSYSTGGFVRADGAEDSR